MRPVKIVTADDQGRIDLGGTRVRPGDRFTVSRNAQGQILLTPMLSRQPKAREDPNE